MIRVKDTSGNIIPGIYRTESGGLVVDKKEDYEKFKLQQSILLGQKNKIDNMSAEIDRLKLLVEKLIHIK